MEPSDKQLIIERIGRTLLFFCGIAAVIWLLPDWVRSYKSPVQQPVTETPNVASDILSLSTLLPNEAVRDEQLDGVHFVQYLFKNPQEQALELRERLNEQSIENYHLMIDDTDHEIYIYHRGILHTRALFIQKRIAPIPPKDSNPMIAIVIGGLGFQNTKNLVKHPTPLTLAFSPMAPFSISLAESSALHWHEVIVDTRGLQIKKPETILPFASGTLSQKPSKIQQTNVMSMYPGFSKAKNPLGLLTKKHLDVPSLIIQSKQKSIENGFSGMLIEYNDPELPIVLEWSQQAKKEGFLIVMASELRYRNAHQTQEKQAPVMHE